MLIKYKNDTIDSFDINDDFFNHIEVVKKFTPKFNKLNDITDNFILFIEEEIVEHLDEFREYGNITKEFLTELVDIYNYLISFLLELECKELSLTFGMDYNHSAQRAKIYDYLYRNKNIYFLPRIKVDETEIITLKIMDKTELTNCLWNIIIKLLEIRKLFPERKYHKNIKEEKCDIIYESEKIILDTIKDLGLYIINLCGMQNFNDIVLEKRENLIQLKK